MSGWWSARHWRRRAVLAALLACFLRALNPPGAMLAFVDGGPSWVPCVADAMPGMATAAPATSAPGMPAEGQHAAHHHDHAHHGTAAAGPMAAHSGHAASVCPFAVAHAAGLQSPPVATLVPVWLPLLVGAPVAAAQVPRLPPLRFHAPRGPPVLA